MAATIGGQAVLEGVMMRSPSNWALAVRKPNGEVAQLTFPIESPQKRHPIFRWPVIRGVVALGESLAIGFRALAISANYAAQAEAQATRSAAQAETQAARSAAQTDGRAEPARPEVGTASGAFAAQAETQAARSAAQTDGRAEPARPEDGVAVDAEVETELSRGAIIFAFAIAIGFAVMLFKVTPALITNWLPIDATGAFVVVEGLIRVTLFIAYLSLISLLPDLRRVFQYHGAEHKAINALEAGEELTPEKVQRHSLIHPRCGTAFLLWVMVIAIFVFAFFGQPVWYWLIASRILLLPVIAGIAYELIRFAGKHSGNRILMTLLAPGLWLQRLTTREPTDEQVEVSIRALKDVLRLEGTLGEEERKVEVMA